MFVANNLRSTIARRFLAASAASLFVVASLPAMSAVVCGPGTNVSIPNTFDGIYFNFLNGGSATSGGSIPGWDFNPYNSGTSLSFFWPSTPTGSSGGVVSGTSYQVLPAGTLVSSASTFGNGTATANTAAWRAGPGATVGFLGFRFHNENTSATNYGWAELSVGATSGFPMTIIRYCYDDSGAGIVTGTTPVSLQNYSVE